MTTHGSGNQNVPTPEDMAKAKLFQKDMNDLLFSLHSLGLPVKSNKMMLALRPGLGVNVEVPVIDNGQMLVLLSRLCRAISKLQDYFEPDNALGLTPSCKKHGKNPPFLMVGSDAICLRCLVDRLFPDEDDFISFV